MSNRKDYSSISPSALLLVELKAYTNIPFAKKAAALLANEERQGMHHEEKSGRSSFFRLLLHFENRYYTIEKILSRLEPTNLVEISSGFSFRGLDLCLRRQIHFIDTDLENIIQIKKGLTTSLLTESGQELKGSLEVLPLNVLQEEDFGEIISHFPPGPVIILNEGLLVYLNTDEKKKLCAIIHHILEQRGGYWITGDIYIKRENESEIPVADNAFAEFKLEHQIDENKFDDFEVASSFFRNNGFDILYRESLALKQLSCLELVKEKKQAVINKLVSSASSRETWCLQCRR